MNSLSRPLSPCSRVRDQERADSAEGYEDGGGEGRPAGTLSNGVVEDALYSCRQGSSFQPRRNLSNSAGEAPTKNLIECRIKSCWQTTRVMVGRDHRG